MTQARDGTNRVRCFGPVEFLSSVVAESYRTTRAWLGHGEVGSDGLCVSRSIRKERERGRKRETYRFVVFVFLLMPSAVSSLPPLSASELLFVSTVCARGRSATVCHGKGKKRKTHSR